MVAAVGLTLELGRPILRKKERDTAVQHVRASLRG
jgi:hypothetical protein